MQNNYYLFLKLTSSVNYIYFSKYLNGFNNYLQPYSISIIYDNSFISINSFFLYVLYLYYVIQIFTAFIKKKLS